MPKQTKSRSRGNCCLPYDHPLVNDHKDHYPINSIDQARNALSRVSQHSSVPPWFKGTLSSLKNIVRRKVKAKYPSIEVSTKKKKSSNERLETLAKIADLNVIEWDFKLPELDLIISGKVVRFSNLKIRYVKKFKVIYFRFKIDDNEYIIEFPPVESDAEFDAYKYNANNVAHDLIFNHGLIDITVENALPILKKIIFETINSGQENDQIMILNFNKLDRLKQILEPYKDVGSIQKEIDVKPVEVFPQQIDVDDEIHDDKLEELLPKCRLCNNDVYRDYLCYAHYQAYQDLNRPVINKKNPYQINVNNVNNTFTPARPTSFHTPNISNKIIADRINKLLKLANSQGVIKNNNGTVEFIALIDPYHDPDAEIWRKKKIVIKYNNASVEEISRKDYLVSFDANVSIFNTDDYDDGSLYDSFDVNVNMPVKIGEYIQFNQPGYDDSYQYFAEGIVPNVVYDILENGVGDKLRFNYLKSFIKDELDEFNFTVEKYYNRSNGEYKNQVISDDLAEYNVDVVKDNADKAIDDVKVEELPKCRLCNDDIYKDFMCYKHYQAFQDLNRPAFNKKTPYTTRVNYEKDTFTPAKPTSFHNPDIKNRIIANIVDIPRLPENNHTPFAKIANKLLKKHSKIQ